MESSPYIKKFGASTSMHGASKFILTKSPTRRRLWLIIFIASWAMFIGQMYLVCGRYFQYPKRVVVDVTDSGVPFPWITVCNMHGFNFPVVHRLREVFDTSTGFNHSLLGNSSVDKFIRKYSELYAALDMENTVVNGTEGFLFSQDLWTSNVPVDLLSANSIKFKEFFVSCNYKRKECRYLKDTMLHFNWYYFNCYRYIGGNDYDEKDSDNLHLNEGVLEGWSAVVLAGRGMLGAGDNGRNSIPGVHEVAKSTGGSEGVRVVIHSPGTMAYPMTEGYDVPPGFSASLAFRPGIVQRIDKPYGDCFDNTGKWKSYRETMCMSVCHEELVRKRCGCRDATLPHRMGIETSLDYFLKHVDPSKSDNLKTDKCRSSASDVRNSSCRYCRFINLNASISSTDRIKEYMKYTDCMKQVKDEISSNSTLYNCGCKPPCHRFTYDVTYSLSKWPSTGYEGLGIWADIFRHRKFLDRFKDTSGEHELYSNYINSTGLTVLEDFSRINVFVRDSSVVQTIEGPDYLLFQLLSDVGGQLGIWIGVSVITVTEAFEVMFLLLRNALFSICKRRRAAENDAQEVQSFRDQHSGQQGDQLKTEKEEEIFENVAA